MCYPVTQTLKARLDYVGGFRWLLHNDGAGVTAPVLSSSTGNQYSPTWTNHTPGISQKLGSTTTYNHAGIKNNDAQSQSATSVSAVRDYDAWGNVIASSGTFQGRFGYGGPHGYQEDETGLKLLGHRFYDSLSGRFLTRDKVKEGSNWYAYTANNPLVFADPNGLWRRVLCSILGGVVGLIVTGGNPLGAAAGAAIGGSLGSAADQIDETGHVDIQKAALDGAYDGVASYVGGALVSKLCLRYAAMTIAEDGTTTFVHYTSQAGKRAIEQSGYIRASSGPGLGSLGGSVYGFPKPMPGIARLMGVNTSEVITVQVPAGSVKQAGFGFLLHRGNIELP